MVQKSPPLNSFLTIWNTQSFTITKKKNTPSVLKQVLANAVVGPLTHTFTHVPVYSRYHFERRKKNVAGLFWSCKTLSALNGHLQKIESVEIRWSGWSGAVRLNDSSAQHTPTVANYLGYLRSRLPLLLSRSVRRVSGFVSHSVSRLTNIPSPRSSSVRLPLRLINFTRTF